MFNIYIRNFNQNGILIAQETLLQTIPATSEGELKLISPIPKCEMGKAECLDFSIESGTKFYDAFLQMKTYIRIEYDGDTIFYGRVLTIDNNGFRGTRKIRCEGPLSLLLDSPVEGIEETKRNSITIYAYMQKLIDNHNAYVENDPDKRFILGEVPGHYSSVVSEEQKIKEDSRKFGSDSWTDTKSALEDLRSHYGGYFRTRVSSEGIYLDWMNHYFNSDLNTQTIEVGKNILDISNITEIDNIFTAIIPIGKGTVTKSNGQSGSTQTSLYIDGYRTDVHGDNKILKVSDIAKVYTDEQLASGYHKPEHYKNANTKYGTIIKTVSFSDATTKEKLFNDACEWIKNNYQDDVTKFTVKAIDMHQIGENTSKIMVGDQVTLKYPVGKEDGTFENQTTTQTCLNITYDLYHPENNSYTFGIPANILTKTYGLKKQSKSVKGGGGGSSGDDQGGSDPEKNLLNLVANWLMRHGLTYTGPKPYKNSQGTKDEDPYQSSTALYEPSVISGDQLVKATRIKWKLKKEPDGHFVPSYLLDNNEKVYPDEYYTDTVWSGSLASIKSFTLDTIVAYHVPEYVQYEYGADLWTLAGGTAPTITVGEDGEVSIQVPEVNPDTGEIETVKRMYIDGTLHEIGFYGPDNEKVYSMMDSNGNWKYWYQDKEGNWKTTNVRDLSIMAINTENKVGWVVQENSQGDLEFANPGEMTMAIENFIGGPLVVTRVSGELIYLGNTKTQRLTAVSLNHMDQVCGDVEYVPDELDPNLKNVVIKSGGGTRTRYYKKALKKGGDPNNPDDWEYEKVIDPITGKEAYVVSETGVYTEDNLVGGIISSKLNDGTVREKIFGDYVDLVANNVAKFGIIDPETGTLTGGVITEKLNAQGDTYTKIKGKYLDIIADQVMISSEQTSETLKSWVDNKDAESEIIFDSAIWKSRDQVTNVAGSFKFVKNPDGTTRMVIVSGGGLNIEKDNVEFGIYDSGTLTGGVVTEKINNQGDTYTKIKGKYLDIIADQVMISSEQTSETLKAWVDNKDAESEIIFDSAIWKSRDQVTNVAGSFKFVKNPDGTTRMVIISGGGLNIEKDNVEFGIYDSGTLTGGVVTEKINNQGDTYTKISGKYVDIIASTVRIGDTSDIKQYKNRASFPVTGDPNYTYIAKDTEKAYVYDPEVAKTYVEVDHTYRTWAYMQDGLVAEKATIVELNAQKARIDNIEADYIKTTELETDIGKVETLYVQNLHSSIYNGEITFTNHYGNNYVLNIPGGGGSVETEYLQNGVRSISLEQSGNTYTLKSKNYLGRESEIGSFSRAITGWEDVWDSNGDVSVKATPQNQSHKVTQTLVMRGTTQYSNCDVSLGFYDSNSNFIAKKSKYVHLYLTGTGSTATVEAREDSTSGTAHASISVADVWSAGYSSGYNYNLPAGISVGTITNNSTTVPTGATHIDALDTSTFWNSASFKETYGYAKIPITVHGKTKDFYFAFDNRKLASGGNPAYGAGYSAGLPAGRLAVNLSGINWSSYSGSTIPASRTVSATTTGRTNASGTDSNITKSQDLYLVDGDWASGTKTVYLRSVNSTSGGTTFMQKNVSVSLQEKSVTENGDVTPDSGYQGLSKVTVNVSTGSISIPKPPGGLPDQAGAGAISSYISGCTQLTFNSNNPKAGNYYKFKVTCGSKTKWYYIHCVS